jgi:malyl-CoA/(S)-citramalyl-CoA lyase
MRAAVLGCEGKWATTEEFVGIANDAFSPSPQAITLARRVLEAAAEAERSGGGVVMLDNKPIYMPQIKQARTLVEQAAMMDNSSLA